MRKPLVSALLATLFLTSAALAAEPLDAQAVWEARIAGLAARVEADPAAVELHHEGFLRLADSVDNALPDAETRLDAASREAERLGLPETALALSGRAAAASARPNGAVAAVRLEREANLLQALERAQEAEERLRRALALREAATPQNPALLVGTLERLAGSIERARPADPEVSTLLARRAEIAPSWSGYDRLGRHRAARGDHDGAVEAFGRAVEAAAAAPDGSALLGSAATLDRLAEVESKGGRPGEARAALARALALRESYYGGRHPVLADTHFRIGQAEVALERLEEAQRSLELALELRDRAYGGCLRCARPIAELLGQVDGALGRVREMCDVDEPVPEAQDSTPPPAEEKSEVRLLAEEADRRLARGEAALALAAAREAVARAEVESGPDAEETVTALDRQARIEERMGFGPAARRTRERELAVLERQAAPALARQSAVLGALAARSQTDRDVAAAASYLERQAALLEASDSPMALAQVLEGLGARRSETGDVHAAAEALQRAADVWEAVSGRDAREYVRARIALAQALAALGRPADARDALAALADRERKTGSREDVLRDIATAAERLATPGAAEVGAAPRRASVH